MCSGVYRLSRRTVEGLMSDFFNVDISLGSVSACEGTVSNACAVSVAEAREHVQRAPVAHVDETGYRQAFQADLTSPPGEAKPSPKAWLWAAVTPFVTVFGGPREAQRRGGEGTPRLVPGRVSARRWSGAMRRGGRVGLGPLERVRIHRRREATAVLSRIS